MKLIIRIETENNYDMQADVIPAFHYGLQIARVEMENKGHKVWGQILEEIHENMPSIQEEK